MSGRYQAYSEYKNSGSEWIRYTPSHWSVSKLKYYTKQIVDGAHFTPTYTDDGVPFLRVTDIQSKCIDMNNIKFIPQAEHDELIKRCNPKKGDLLLSKNGTIGIPKIVDWDFDFSIFVSLCLIKIKPTLDVRFVAYFFLSQEIKEQISGQIKQSTVINLHLDKIENFDFALPLLSEQQKIANFLDHETAKIDTLIAKQEKLIALLKEKRQAVISHAVTRGLNPKAPMKNSGVEWLGEVPEHWEIKRLKYLCDIQTGSRNTENAIDNGKYPFFVRSQTVERINSKTFNCEAVLTAGDGVGVGKVYHYVNGEFDFHQRVYMLNKFKLTNGKFIFNYLEQNFYKVAMAGQAKSTVDSLRLPLFLNFEVTVPPEKEQEDIIEYIGHIKETFDTLMNKANKSIVLIKERKTALISAAVTGKIDVRNWKK